LQNLFFRQAPSKNLLFYFHATRRKDLNKLLHRLFFGGRRRGRVWLVKDKYVFGMAAIRIISSMLEFSAALLMLKLNRVESAMKVNALLAFVGPMILLTVTGIGLAGLAGKTDPIKMIIIGMGVILIFIGVNK
jgi:hypothetical protein